MPTSVPPIFPLRHSHITPVLSQLSWSPSPFLAASSLLATVGREHVSRDMLNNLIPFPRVRLLECLQICAGSHKPRRGQRLEEERSAPMQSTTALHARPLGELLPMQSGPKVRRLVVGKAVSIAAPPRKAAKRLYIGETASLGRGGGLYAVPTLRNPFPRKLGPELYEKRKRRR